MHHSFPWSAVSIQRHCKFSGKMKEDRRLRMERNYLTWGQPGKLWACLKYFWCVCKDRLPSYPQFLWCSLVLRKKSGIGLTAPAVTKEMVYIKPKNLIKKIDIYPSILAWHDLTNQSTESRGRYAMDLLVLWLYNTKQWKNKLQRKRFQVNWICSAPYYLRPVLVNISPAYSHSHCIWYLHMTHFILGEINWIEKYY